MNWLSHRTAGLLIPWLAIGFTTLDICRAASPDARLVKMLTGKNEAVRIKAIVNLQSGSPAESIATLCDAARAHSEETNADDLARVSTIELLYLIGSTRLPDAESLLVEMLDANHSGIAMVAADALGKYDFEGSIESLKKQIDRSEFATSYGFRFNLVRALAQLEHPDAIEFLDSLSRELDGQLRYEVDKLLKDVSEADFRGDEQRFKEWEVAHAPKIVLKPAGFESESRKRLNLVPTQQYYGIDIHAKRMMFIIDHSGSMNEVVAGNSRLDRAKMELIRTINELPEEAEFAITFYSDNVRPWQSELAQATEINKKQAVESIRKLVPGGMTNTYGALRRSMLFDSQLEAVFLLTDGRPTCGDIVAPQAIIQDIVHRNRFRHLKVNTIGIAVDGPMQQFLQTLAENTAGEFRQSE